MGYTREELPVHTKKSTSLFNNLETMPGDPIFGLMALYAKDPAEKKASLTIGVYRDEEGKPWVLPTVKKVEKIIAEDVATNHEYLPMEGLQPFVESARDLLFGNPSASLTSRIGSLQTISGTGAVHLGARFLNDSLSPKRIWVSDPTWGNHHAIFDVAAPNVEQKMYPYYDAATCSLNFTGMMETLERDAQPGDLILLHACAHNPTGIDPTKEQWEKIADLCERKQLFPFFDSAYQGFASGDVDEDAWAVRHFVSRGTLELVVAQSFSKNFGLYGQRVGAFHIVAADQDAKDKALSNLIHLQRAEISNPPVYGARIVAFILRNEELKREWEQDLLIMSGRIKAMRAALYGELQALQTPGSWEHIVNQNVSTEVDLYAILEISRSASKTDIKKAYHKAARTHHPDKVPEDQRAAADERFKDIQQAYEILSDDSTREMYDMHGMAAFEKGGAGGGAGPDLDDILAQMFGQGMGGMGGGFEGMGGMPGMGGMGGRGPRKSKNEVQEYEVTLEELYKGKTTRFASTKNVICTNCEGSGGKANAKPKKCGTCDGRGSKVALRPVGPGLVTQETVPCSTCSGRGSYFPDDKKCKKCKGVRTTSQRKILELYIPPGSRQGDKIVLSGEADQVPDQEPGDIIFELVEAPHEVFHRAGADLQAELKISLQEALTGFNRVVLKHLDGRGISMHVTQPAGRILRPGEILKIAGEGMPIKRSDAKGDLYLIVDVVFPEDGWIKDEATIQKIRDVLPKTGAEDIKAEEVDEVDFEVVKDMDDFGAGSGDPRAAEWEDDFEEEGEAAQCAQQ
ncbi:aspartate aminotransferase, partial [Aureobasidium melanogenum]